MGHVCYRAPLVGPGGGSFKRFALAVALVALLAGVFVTAASALRFDDEKPCLDTQPVFVCPSGTIGTPYSIQLQGAGGCGPALPYQYRILNGALPSGLSLSSGGLISGTPTGAGTALFWVELSDKDPINPDDLSENWCRPAKAERQFSITIAAGLSINNQSVPPGTVGQAYSQTLIASLVTSLNPPTGPQVSATWSVHSGTLPPGVTLSSSGLLAGTPTAEGTYQFVVRAESGGQTDIETLTIVVRQPLVISSPFASPTPPKSEVGVPFSAALTATGGEGTFTWALAGGLLPTGVAFGIDGTIAGTPQVAGRFPFSVTATDAEGRVTTLNATLVVAAKLAIKTLRLRAAKIGRLYRAKVATLGGVAPTKWKILRGKLPQGVRFDKKLAVFLGTPRREGTYRVTVQVVDALGVKSQKTLAIVVTA
jgi:hypothetical protein